ncbi:GNAT family N-acetyltransferase [Halobacillus seohaensis]|uniref:GNAT family N-acetyltransferase n=1 Tax=Halobacillus seohaensis TaxID=447421 RepID=A0ABW2ET72_9BACI
MWVNKTFEELTKDELYKILELRVKVFVVEQTCPYQEVDGRDDECIHIWKEEDGHIQAYCRIVPPISTDDSYSIGRVLVVEEARGKGYGREIMDKAIHLLTDDLRVLSIGLHGQEYLRHFYGSFGFEEISNVYLEDEIPHVDMLMKVK